MISEVQYGGRITDDLDRITFNVFTDNWLSPFTSTGGALCTVEGSFRYGIPPNVDQIDSVRKYITTFPTRDSPKVCGACSGGVQLCE